MLLQFTFWHVNICQLSLQFILTLWVMNGRDQGLQYKTLCQIWLLGEHQASQGSE